MNILRKYKISAIIVSLLTFLSFIGLDNFSEFTKCNSKTITIIIFILFSSTALLIDTLCNNKNTNTIIKATKWDHSILIIDDKASDLATIMDCLKGYNLDIVTLRDISDYRLAENFEIIIGDIWGLGAAGKNSISVLNQIKLKYPYKIVLAMSSAPATCNGLKIDGEIISKENKGLYPHTILEKINYYSSKLAKYDEYWNDVNSELIRQQVSAIEQQRIKEDYHNYIKKRNRHLTD